MKKRSNISFGPGAASLILIFVVLTLSVLGMLSLMNARNDKALSQRSASVLECVYALNSEAERSRAVLDEVLWTLRPYCDQKDEYLDTLNLILDAAKNASEGDEYSALLSAQSYLSENAADSEQETVANRIFIKLGENRSEFIKKLAVLNKMTLDGDVVCWSQTDSSDELTISNSVYGLRTLECGLQILPPSEDKRSQWVSHRLLTTLADDDEAFFED
ncbi:MAG: hypothetical protein II875_11410 [Clostridia bacterium]|nr:hypothetical protein [Clostridia bacterium]